MNPQQSLEIIGKVGIIPVIRCGTSAEAVLAAEALEAGGISIVEITMTVPGALDAIRKVSSSLGSRVLVGAGTVVNAAQAADCFAAGAEFLVSPGLSVPVLQAAQQKGKLAIPGVLTPTELIAAAEAGAPAMKVFPCGNLGGPQYIKALRGPFPKAILIPTGGVSTANAADYLRAGAFAVGAGGELVNAAALREGRVHEITVAAQELQKAVSNVRQP